MFKPAYLYVPRSSEGVHEREAKVNPSATATLIFTTDVPPFWEIHEAACALV